jgi:hypothetical protein
LKFLGSCEKAFDSLDEDIDYVINLASETRKGQSEPVYKEGILKLSNNVMQNVQRRFGDRLKTYVEFSTGALYSSDRVKALAINLHVTLFTLTKCISFSATDSA